MAGLLVALADMHAWDLTKINGLRNLEQLCPQAVFNFRQSRAPHL